MILREHLSLIEGEEINDWFIEQNPFRIVSEEIYESGPFGISTEWYKSINVTTTFTGIPLAIFICSEPFVWE